MSKRNIAAQFAVGSGFVGVLEHLSQRNCLLVLTHHRIGDPNATPYDTGAFSGTPDQLDGQVSYLKKRFHIVGLEEALHFMKNGERHKKASVLITFDDGYRDNHQFAFKVLRTHGVEGVFFLPTEHIDTGRVPWWDAIAYAVKRTQKDKIRLEYPGADFDFGENRGATIHEVLSLYKGPLNRDPGRFLQSLAAACEIELPTVDKTLFMSWSDASEMIQGGMTIGSHTHTHRILSKLTPEQQLEELTVSRTLLEQKLKTRVRSVAYPVGAQNCFSDATMRCTKDAGFELGFSFYGGVNLPGKTDRFDVRRLGLSLGQSFSRFRTNVNLCAVAGKDWTF